MPHRAPQDATQDIAASIVRGKYSVRQQERDRARVVCEHTVRRRIIDDLAPRARPAAPLDAPGRIFTASADSRPRYGRPTAPATVSSNGAKRSVW